MARLMWILVACLPFVSAGVDEICGRQELTEVRPCDGDSDCCCYLNRCSYFEPAERVDCGYPGITEQQCWAKGCCYSEVPLFGFNWCWYPVCTKTNMDVCFLVDMSGSVSQAELDNALALIGAVSQQLTLGEDAIRTCIIPFESYAYLSPALAGHDPLPVPALTRGGGTDVQAALDLMDWQFAENGRPGNCRVGVLFSDGDVFGGGLYFPDNIEMVAVGMTSLSMNSQQMLADFATGDDLTNVLISQTSDGSDLTSDEFVQALRHLICCPDN